MKIDISEEERHLIRGLLAYRWGECDQTRMNTRPDSFEERLWLEEQQAIEILQAKLVAK